MRLRVTARAKGHIKHIGGYLRERDARACEHILVSVHDTLTDLQRFAFLGHEGIVEGTRERSLPGYPYVVVYRVDIDMKRGDEVVILAVFHCAQDR